MTIEEFLKALGDDTRAGALTWRRTTNGLRLDCRPHLTREFCPLTYVCYRRTGERYPAFQFMHAARTLGIANAAAADIAGAADELNDLGWKPLAGTLAVRVARACGVA